MKKQKTPTSALAVRIVAFILAFLMIAGGTYYVIVSILAAFSESKSDNNYTQLQGNADVAVYDVCDIGKDIKI